MASILLLEDDLILSKGIQIALKKDLHDIKAVYSYFDGVKAYMQQPFDLYLLDINLPDGNGLMFCKKLRESSDAPVIFLTANDTEQDMLQGYQYGCDDYIAKPFSIEVLRQKVFAVLRRLGSSNPVENNLFIYKDLEINFDKMQVYINHQECKLTVTEYKILEYLIHNKGKVLTRTMLLEQIWDVDGNFIDENTLSVHIRRLRQKIESDTKSPRYIITVFGIGYTFGT